jgi:GNAT superfamily N-acetyltransferase
MHIRAAKPEEAEQLSTIAYEAKRHWGYSDEAMRQWTAALRIEPQDVVSNPTFVMQDEDTLVGFYMLWTDGRLWELEHLWVTPHAMRKGIGRSLLNHANNLVRAGGGHSLHIDADPNAEPFYAACGARHVGSVAAPIPELKDRMRPLLEIDLRESVA